MTGSSSTVVHCPLPPDDPTQRRPDIGLARSVLRWQPEVDLRDGLTRAAAYFEKIVCGGG